MRIVGNFLVCFCERGIRSFGAGGEEKKSVGHHESASAWTTWATLMVVQIVDLAINHV